MNYILFLLYLGLFCWLLTKIKFVTGTDLGKKLIILLFLARIVAGLINGYLSLYHYPGTDTAHFHREGLTEYHLLFNDPKEYFVNIFKYNKNYSAFLEVTNSFWNNLRDDLMVKLLSIFDILSFGNFFINTIFYNFLVFFGSVSLYKIFISLFPGKRTLLIISLFLLPSLIYFTSGVHKDGLIFLGIGITCYYLFSIFKKGFTVKKLLWIFTGLLIIFLIRNFVFLTLIPALIAWIIAEKFKRYPLVSFIATYSVFVAIFFLAGNLSPKLDLPHYVSQRQIAFINIAGLSNSSVPVDPLYPNPISFIKNVPQALNHTLMRPYLTENFTSLSIPADIEILIFDILFILFLFFPYKERTLVPFIYFVIFFGVSMLLMIGYTIPIMGALVRYRSIYLVFLVTPMLCYTNWEKIRRSVSGH